MPSKIRGKVLTKSPYRKRCPKLTNTRCAKPINTKNFIKENIESVGVGTRRKREEQGKTRVVYDVQYEGSVYRVLPCHVKSTPNYQVLSVNIEEDMWVDVARQAGNNSQTMTH
jgi:hypothetical protein